jgi:hypothetical protein
MAPYRWRIFNEQIVEFARRLEVSSALLVQKRPSRFAELVYRRRPRAVSLHPQRCQRVDLRLPACRNVTHHNRHSH